MHSKNLEGKIYLFSAISFSKALEQERKTQEGDGGEKTQEARRTTSSRKSKDEGRILKDISFAKNCREKFCEEA